jgi:hypothetical protein
MNRNVNPSSHFLILRKRNHPVDRDFGPNELEELGEIDDLYTSTLRTANHRHINDTVLYTTCLFDR